jgi:hypothetical protein
MNEFKKQNYNVLSHNFHIYVSVSDLSTSRINLPILPKPKKADGSREYMIHECRNWE